MSATRRERGSVRRALLATIVALGGVITLVGTTGVFAVFTDRATTGTNTWATKDLPHAADLQLATGPVTVDTTWTVECGTYTDDLESGLVTLTDAAPGAGFGTDFLCVKNAGSQTVDVTTSAVDVTDLDTDCTGDEAAVDTTCGVDASDVAQQGELGPLVQLGMHVADCADANQGGSGIGAVADLSGATVATLAPGETVCVKYEVDYNPTEAQAMTAQSDTLTWRFAFDGTVPTT
jgi:predicted ribosomally synthesized peptide with SipW-like signal peptide